MAISLYKDKSATIPARENAIEFVSISLTWETRKNFGPEFDLDLSCFLLDSDDKITDEKDFVFYNNFNSTCGSVKFWGDNRIGENHESDNELITIDFPKIKDNIKKVIITVSIYESLKRHQTFGLINNIKVNIANRQDGIILSSHELD